MVKKISSPYSNPPKLLYVSGSGNLLSHSIKLQEICMFINYFLSNIVIGSGDETMILVPYSSLSHGGCRQEA